jgi:hypothetical protein
MRKLNELLIYIKKKGIKETIRRLYARYASVLEFRLSSIDLENESIEVQNDSKYSIVIDDMNELARIRGEFPQCSREFYIDKTHGGKRFYLYLLNGEPVYIHWVFGKNEYSRFFNIKNQKIVELQYAYTMPKFRGNKIIGNALNFACSDLKKKGYKRVMSAVSEGNVACIKGMEITGFRKIATVKSFFSFTKKVTVLN